MVVESKHGTPDPIPEDPPFENRGVCIVETDIKKIIFIPPLTQPEIDAIARARENRDFFDSKEMGTNNLAHVIYANTYLPWGFDLLNREHVIKTITATVTRMEDVLKRTDNHYQRLKHPEIFGVVNYIRANLAPLTLRKKTD